MDIWLGCRQQFILQVIEGEIEASNMTEFPRIFTQVCILGTNIQMSMLICEFGKLK